MVKISVFLALTPCFDGKSSHPMRTQTPLERLQTLLPDVFEPKAQTGELYLRLGLTPSVNAAIPLNTIVETSRIPTQSITSIPNMPACTLGLMGYQGKVFWVVDLPHLMGLTPGIQRPRQYDLIIVETLSMTEQGADSLLLGLSVHQIQSTLRFQSSEILPPTAALFAAMRPYLSGVVQQQGLPIGLLNLGAIVNAPSLVGP